MAVKFSRKFARFGYGILILLVVMLGVIVSVGNASSVALEIVTYRTGELPLSLWLVLSFLLGMAISAIFLSGSYFKSKLENRTLHQTLRKQQTSSPVEHSTE